MPDKHQLHDLIERLPDCEILAAATYLESILSREAPVDPEMLARIDLARKDRSPGISHMEVLREFDL